MGGEQESAGGCQNRSQPGHLHIPEGRPTAVERNLHAWSRLERFADAMTYPTLTEASSAMGIHVIIDTTDPRDAEPHSCKSSPSSTSRTSAPPKAASPWPHREGNRSRPLKNRTHHRDNRADNCLSEFSNYVANDLGGVPLVGGGQPRESR